MFLDWISDFFNKIVELCIYNLQQKIKNKV